MKELFQQYAVIIALIVIIFVLYYSFIAKVPSDLLQRGRLYLYLAIVTVWFLICFIIIQLNFKRLLLFQYCSHHFVFGSVGIMYCVFNTKKQEWWIVDKVAQILLVTLNILIGVICLLIIHKITNAAYLYFPMLICVIGLLVPISFYETYRRALAIPGISYPSWIFPLTEDIPIITDSDLRDPIVIGFRIQKQRNKPIYTYFRAKAPIKMDLGNLFYHFVNDYNERHPDTGIEYLAPDGNTSKWVFYRKFWFFNIRILDPDKAIFMNRIKENYIIYCKRIC